MVDVDVNLDEWDEEGRQKPEFAPTTGKALGMI